VYSEIALSDVALAGVANLGWLSEAEELGRERPRHGNHVYGSFGVDFACSDGNRVMVVALTPGQWSALVSVTGTGAVFAALEQALYADLTDETERYRLRDTIAAVLKPWFAARDSKTVEDELNRARVLWGRYQGMTDVVAAHRSGQHALLADLPLPGGATAITARSPLRWNGEHGDAGVAPQLGADTDQVLSEVLGLGDAEIGALHDRHVVGGNR
jgi:2-methylfumaryl-CoA isomerase